MTVKELKEIVDAQIAAGNEEVEVYLSRENENRNVITTWAKSAEIREYGPYQDKCFVMVEG